MAPRTLVPLLAIVGLAGCLRAGSPPLPDARTLGPFDAELERFEEWVQQTPREQRAGITGAARTAVARYFVAVRSHLQAHGVAFSADATHWNFVLAPGESTELGRLARELADRYQVVLVYDVGFFARSSAGAGAAATPDTLFCDHQAIREINGRTASIAHELEHVHTHAAFKDGRLTPYHSWAYGDLGWTNNVPFDELNAYDADVVRAADEGSRQPGTLDAGRLAVPAGQGLQRAELLVHLLERLLSSGAHLGEPSHPGAGRLFHVSLFPAQGSDHVDVAVDHDPPAGDEWIRGQLRGLLDLTVAHRARFQLSQEVAEQADDRPVPGVQACALGRALARKPGEPPAAWQARAGALARAFEQQVAGPCGAR